MDERPREPNSLYRYHKDEIDINEVARYILNFEKEDGTNMCILRNNTSLTSINIPNGTQNIGKGVFRNCSSLVSISIPNSVTSIREKAFEFCTSLSSLNFPENLLHIEQKAFQDYSNISSLVIPSNVLEVHKDAFKNCSSLKSVTIMSSESFIFPYAFANCFNLVTISIPGYKNGIFSRAFEDCSNISMVTFTFTCTGNGSIISTSLDPIYYFKSSLLKTFIIGPNITEIALSDSFFVNQYIDFITIPNTLKSIQLPFLKDCSIKITQSGSLKGITSSLLSQLSFRQIKSIIIDENITYTEENSFKNLNYLENVSIPASLTSIGKRSFAICNYLE